MSEEVRPKARIARFNGDQTDEQGSWSQRSRTSREYHPGLRKPIQNQASTVGPNTGSARARAINRNAKRLLVYVLDVSATLAQNQVVIDLARRQRKTTGEWGPLRPWYYAPHAAHVKYDPEDRLLLALLDEAQGGASQGGYASPNSEAGPGVLQGLASGMGASNGAGS